MGSKSEPTEELKTVLPSRRELTLASQGGVPKWTFFGVRLRGPLGSPLLRAVAPFGANLGQPRVPKGSQRGPKSDPKTVQNGVLNFSPPRWPPWGSLVEPRGAKRTPKVAKMGSQKGRISGQRRPNKVHHDGPSTHQQLT